MKTRLINLWEKLRTTFWLVPTIMVIGAIGMFSLLVGIDKNNQVDVFLYFSFLEPLSPNGARVILSTIAGSMITVAGTVFSITIVALTLASNQFGPRLLRNFMQSTTNQVVLGSFIATFVYCLCTLSSVEPAGRASFVPELAVNFSIVLSLLNVGILIFFIHHVATSIQVETVLENINNDFLFLIDESFPEDNNEVIDHEGCIQKFSEFQRSCETKSVKADDFGYLQAIDKVALKDFAEQNDCMLEVKQSPGTFIIQSMPLVKIYTPRHLDEKTCKKLRDVFLLGPHRTSEQDLEYSIRQFVEIAVRALSPGVNDPFTALSCIDYLGSAVCRIACRNSLSEYMVSESGALQVRLKATTFKETIEAAFDEIRRYGYNNTAILIRLLEVFYEMLALCGIDEKREIVLQQAAMVHRAGVEHLQEETDREKVGSKYKAIMDIAHN